MLARPAAITQPTAQSVFKELRITTAVMVLKLRREVNFAASRAAFWLEPVLGGMTGQCFMVREHAGKRFGQTARYSFLVERN